VPDDEIAQLREEVARLRAELAEAKRAAEYDAGTIAALRAMLNDARAASQPKRRPGHVHPPGLA
jgi:cell division septum initiation protein DivIVA